MAVSKAEFDALRAALLEGRVVNVAGPFEALVGYRVRYDASHGLYLELDLTDKHLNQYGVAHGGVTLTLLDAVGGIGCFFAVPGLRQVATVSLATGFVRAVPPGRVLALASLDQVGGTVAHVSMRLRAEGFEGPLLATGTGAYRLFRQREA